MSWLISLDGGKLFWVILGEGIKVVVVGILMGFGFVL